MLELALTIDCCQEMLEYALKRNRWTLARAAREIEVSSSYLRRIQDGQQSFQVSDVKALAKASGLTTDELLFNSIKQDEITAEMRPLYDMVVQDMQRHKKFAAIMTGKPRRKVRSATRMAKSPPKPAAKGGLART